VVHELIADLDDTLTSLQAAVAALQLALSSQDEVRNGAGALVWLAGEAADYANQTRERWNEAFEASKKREQGDGP
jgi:hypothetical protein